MELFLTIFLILFWFVSLILVTMFTRFVDLFCGKTDTVAWLGIISAWVAFFIIVGLYI